MRAVLAQPTWFVRAGVRNLADLEKSPRWRHPALEDLLARPPGLRPDFAHWLDDPDPTVAGNVAIAQARLGLGRPAVHLSAAVRRPQLELAMRRAAVEALGGLPVSQAAPELKGLVAQYGGKSNRTGSSEHPELHAELLVTLGHVAPAESLPLLAAGLQSSSVAVRRAALQGWPVEPGTPLPKGVAAACGDSDPRVRAAAMGLIVAHRPDDVHAVVQRGLTDQDITVRLAAVSGLGELSDRPAQELAVKLLASRNEILRAAAVTALAQMGAGDELAAAADDESPRVRRAVATSLGHTPAAASRAMAHRLIHDPNRGVARAMVAALAQWPLDRAVPVLLRGLTARSFTVRHASAAALADRWPPAAEFSADALASRQDPILKSLDDRWAARRSSPALRDDTTRPRHGSLPRQAGGDTQSDRSTVSQAALVVRRDVDADLQVLALRGSSLRDRLQAVERLIGCGPPLLASLDRWVADTKQPLPAAVYRQVLPQIDARFEVLAQLDSPDLEQRREAARSLVEETRKVRLPSLALRRLETLVVPEADASVWWNVEIALADDPRPAAIRIHLAALSHPGPEVRRRACQYLARRRDPRHTAVLLATLDDASPTVVRAAVIAIGEVAAHGGAERALFRGAKGHKRAVSSSVLDAQMVPNSSDRPETGDRRVSETAERQPVEVGDDDLGDVIAAQRRVREALEGLLIRRDASLRLTVADALTKLGYPSGPAALERLAHDGDPRIRRQVAEKMGQFKHRTFVGTLVRLLDDRHDVRRAALASLQQIVPTESPDASAGSAMTVARQVSRWKRWYSDQ